MWSTQGITFPTTTEQRFQFSCIERHFQVLTPTINMVRVSKNDIRSFVTWLVPVTATDGCFLLCHHPPRPPPLQKVEIVAGHVMFSAAARCCHVVTNDSSSCIWRSRQGLGLLLHSSCTDVAREWCMWWVHRVWMSLLSLCPSNLWHISKRSCPGPTNVDFTVTSSADLLQHSLCLTWLCESTSVFPRIFPLPLWFIVCETTAVESQREDLVCPPQRRGHLSCLFIYLLLFTNSSRLYESAVISYTQSQHLLLRFTSLCSSSFLSLVLHLHLVACWPVSSQESCVCVCVCVTVCVPEAMFSTREAAVSLRAGEAAVASPSASLWIQSHILSFSSHWPTQHDLSHVTNLLGAWRPEEMGIMGNNNLQNLNSTLCDLMNQTSWSESQLFRNVVTVQMCKLQFIYIWLTHIYSISLQDYSAKQSLTKLPTINGTF